MIKDAAAKLLLIPLLGTGIALLSMPGSRNRLPFPEVLFYALFWAAVTFLLWQSTVAVTAFIRNHAALRKQGAWKIFLLLFSTTAFALLITGMAIALWKQLFQNPISQHNGTTYAFLYVAVAPLIGLVYEILFLKMEQELDSKIVAQLDYERQSAELQALNNELDPHFIFNALNVLSPLISIDAAKAQVFTIKLAQVYRYLLHNRYQQLITLRDELRFIQDYFFLLQIRHENKLRLDLNLHEPAINQIMILPFALQVLVENAIKHNQISEEKPLVITVSLYKSFIQVSNTAAPKPYGPESTNVGLKNLSARYKLICNKDIIVHHAADTFLVKLPLIKTTP